MSADLSVSPTAVRGAPILGTVDFPFRIGLIPLRSKINLATLRGRLEVSTILSRLVQGLLMMKPDSETLEILSINDAMGVADLAPAFEL